MKRRFSLIGLVLILSIFLAAPGAFAAYSIKHNWDRISGVAGEALETGDVVCIADADGYVYNADADTATLRGAIGFIGMGGSSGDTVEIVTSGVMRGYTSLAEGQPVYLSETAGGVTQTAPAWCQQIGVAISATEVLLDPQSYAAVFSPVGGTTVAADVLAIPVTHAYVAKTTGADAEALTLADGTPKQVLVIDLAVDGGGAGTLSPTTCSGFTSIVFADAGDNAALMFVDDTVGWIILGLAGVTAPPVTVD